MAQKFPNPWFGFKSAFRGFYMVLKAESHVQFHVFAALVVLVFGFWLEVSLLEWMALLAVIGLVIGLEMINAAIERLCDKIQPEKDPDIKWIKDVAAGAVLIAVIVAVAIGSIIFIPKLPVF